MTWLGLRDRHSATFRPGGLGRQAARDLKIITDDALLTKGTVQFEWHPPARMSAATEPILHYETDVPWPVRITLFFDAGNVLTLAHRVGDQSRWVRLPARFADKADRLVVTYGWNSPHRTGLLSIYDPASGQIWHKDVHDPMPLTQRDARHLIMDASVQKAGAALEWLAVGTHIQPIGPMPSLAGSARVAMEGAGLRALQDLSVGDRVETPDGLGATICWIGSADLIARGHQAPMMLRAPYHGLARDLVVAPTQRISVAGSSVEYLFGVEEVCAAAVDLSDGRSVLSVSGAEVRRAWSVVLDRPAMLLVEGCALEGFDPRPLLESGSALPHSMLRDLPRAALPPLARQDGPPILEDFEARTLAYSGAA